MIGPNASAATGGFFNAPSDLAAAPAYRPPPKTQLRSPLWRRRHRLGVAGVFAALALLAYASLPEHPAAPPPTLEVAVTPPVAVEPPATPVLTAPPREATRPQPLAPIVLPPAEPPPAPATSFATRYAALGLPSDGAQHLADLVDMPTGSDAQITRALAVAKRRQQASPVVRGRFPIPGNAPRSVLALLTQADLDLLELALWQHFGSRRSTVTFRAPLSTRGLSVAGRVNLVPDRGRLEQCYAFAATLTKGRYQAGFEAVACVDRAAQAWVFANPSN